MPSVESVKRDLEVLGTTGQEEILNYLEEIIILGMHLILGSYKKICKRETYV